MLNMGISNKQFLHYQSVARQSLDKFRKIAHEKQVDAVYQLIESDWQAFIEDKERVRRYVDYVQGVDSIFGFSRELSPRLSYEEILSRVAERFAEIDLAEHAIRELGLPKSGGKLEKLTEGTSKKCDFWFSGNPSRYFESKYTKNINPRNLTFIIRKALDQIKNSIDTSGIGCVWIFTYSQPDNTMGFQREVMKNKDKFSGIGFDFKLNVQVYSQGLYGDATVI